MIKLSKLNCSWQTPARGMAKVRSGPTSSCARSTTVEHVSKGSAPSASMRMSHSTKRRAWWQKQGLILVCLLIFCQSYLDENLGSHGREHVVPRPQTLKNAAEVHPFLSQPAACIDQGWTQRCSGTPIHEREPSAFATRNRRRSGHVT